MRRRELEDDERKPERSTAGAQDLSSRSEGPAMRIVVPLQGVVQGSGGIVLGSLIPCALFYFFQVFLKQRHRSRPPNQRDSIATLPPAPESGFIQRSLSSLSTGSAPQPPVSSRAASLVVLEDESPYYVGLRRCLEDPYDADERPTGIVQLGLAENRLSLDLIDRWLKANGTAALFYGSRVLATYQPHDGVLDLKMAVTGFINQATQGLVSFNPSQIVLTAGASPALEILSFCLADPGNAFLVPSPYHPGWDMDIKWRTGIELIPVRCRSTDKFSINVSALRRAYTQAKKRGVKVRAVLISNPSNPVGALLSKDTLCDILGFVMEKNIHLISDELFACSTFGGSKFVSVAEVLNDEDFDRSRVHIIYGLSDDFSLPGFGAGVIYSSNETILSASAKLARFSSISSPTQRLLVQMLSDRDFVLDYLKLNRERLQKTHLLFVNALKQLGIECIVGVGGFYCWVDMSKFIESYSEKGERKLWDKLLSVAKVNMIPGLSCHCIEPGWFGCCFANLQERDIPVVVERLKRVTETRNSRRWI